MFNRVLAALAAHPRAVVGAAAGLAALVTAIWPGFPGEALVDALRVLLDA